eukprot:TRINITY_DN78502_c0_g1_i1.p2 TRINITY_DN78502_c0_g1~~TRINITY_DN78502_c0_g1_i1.p2  ORF type:complete len:108 (+),score=19.22 TRINITY_DN78502_c0_g1_i1:131-454(+)
MIAPDIVSSLDLVSSGSSGPPTARNDLGTWHGVGQEHHDDVKGHAQVPVAFPVLLSDNPATPRQPSINVACMAKHVEHTAEHVKDFTKSPKCELEQVVFASQGSFFQ